MSSNNYLSSPSDCGNDLHNRHSHAHGASGHCRGHDHSAEQAVFDKPFETKIKEVREFYDLGMQALLLQDDITAFSFAKKMQIWMDYTFPEDENKSQFCQVLEWTFKSHYLQARIASCKNETKDCLNHCRLALNSLDEKEYSLSFTSRQIDEVEVLLIYARCYRGISEFKKSLDCIKRAEAVLSSAILEKAKEEEFLKILKEEKVALRVAVEKYKASKRVQAQKMFDTKPK